MSSCYTSGAPRGLYSTGPTRTNEFQYFMDDGDLVEVTAEQFAFPVVGVIYDESENFIFMAVYSEETNPKERVKGSKFGHRYFGPTSHKVFVITNSSISSMLCSERYVLLEPKDVS